MIPRSFFRRKVSNGVSETQNWLLWEFFQLNEQLVRMRILQIGKVPSEDYWVENFELYLMLEFFSSFFHLVVDSIISSSLVWQSLAKFWSCFYHPKKCGWGKSNVIIMLSRTITRLDVNISMWWNVIRSK